MCWVCHLYHGNGLAPVCITAANRKNGVWVTGLSSGSQQHRKQLQQLFQIKVLGKTTVLQLHFCIRQLYPRQDKGLCPSVFMLCNFTQFCLAARRFSSSLICPCSWMHRDGCSWMLMDALFHCQRDRLTFRPFALGEELTN